LSFWQKSASSGGVGIDFHWFHGISRFPQRIFKRLTLLEGRRQNRFCKEFLFFFGCEERKRIKTYVRTAADEKNKNFKAKGRF